MLYYSVNGQPKSSIDISDRSIAYGDGIFTTAKIVDGQVQFLSAHLNRLAEGCHYLKINFIQSQAFVDEIVNVAKGFTTAVLKIIVTAGSGGRGYSRQGVSGAQVIVSIHDMPTHYQAWSEQGISLVNSHIQLGLNPLLKGLKHLNRLEQVLIRDELDNTPADDLLVCDLNGFVVETSCANIFWLRDEQVFTPVLDDAGVRGLYRQNILSFDTSIKQVKEKMSDLADISAMFICNSVMGIVPVKKFNNNQLDTDSVIHYRHQYFNYFLDKECEKDR
ncbi:aminodeoxychorismate lyase [Thalassotalea sp. SU-HH00458]|uniref:aminodeoxychorismate lyase n=1 Tax=Thalassotalea sp. SU-HH00458 TaxID=3127657 RepID=UPI00310BD6EE